MHVRQRIHPPGPVGAVHRRRAGNAAERGLRGPPTRTAAHLGRAFVVAPGSAIEFRFELENRSDSPVTLPLVDYEGDTYYAAGSVQTWLQKLGLVDDVDCFPRAARKETWFATGGWIAVSKVPVVLEPGDSLPSLFDVTLTPEQTGCVPAGDYRFHVEYKPLLGDLEDVIAERSIPFTISGGSASGPPANPDPTPLPTPTPSPTVTPAPSPAPHTPSPSQPPSTADPTPASPAP